MLLSMMNVGHTQPPYGVFRTPKCRRKPRFLDICCGRGRNIAHMLRMAAEGRVYGVDYSTESVAKSTKLNQTAVARGKEEVI